MSGKMLFEWLGQKHGNSRAIRAAELVDKAMDIVISEGKMVTRDIGGKASTQEMGDEISATIKRISSESEE